MAKEKAFTLIVDGVCSVIWGGERHVPGDEFEVSEEALHLPGLESLIARGDLRIKDAAKEESEIKERVSSRRKKSPLEGKTLSEIENGGTF